MPVVNGLFKPKKHWSEFELWKDVTEEQWNDWLWQLTNTIRNLKDLKSIINLTPEEEEGERRLMYVAMTRARDWLHLISARTREVNGRRRERVPSRYLDLPAGIVERKYL